MRELAQARRIIHLTTDSWTSPDRLEFQAITARHVNKDIKRSTALLALPRFYNGHAGEEVAIHVFEAIQLYAIERRLGCITSDDAGSNDTLCKYLAGKLQLLTPPVYWDPLLHRIRCNGHTINIATQAFMTAANAEAVELAIESSQCTGIDVEDRLISEGAG